MKKMSTEKIIEQYKTYFGEGTEEEQLRLREIAASLNIRDNDALWIIVYVMNYFGRFYKSLPEEMSSSATAITESVRSRCEEIASVEMDDVKKSLAESVIHYAENISQAKAQYSVVLPLAWLSFGLFFLCLISFVSGAAVAGKGWGKTPFDSMLAAPAGWIIPIALLPVSIYTGYDAWIKKDIARDKKNIYVKFLFCATGLIIALLCFLRFF